MPGDGGKAVSRTTFIEWVTAECENVSAARRNDALERTNHWIGRTVSEARLSFGFRKGKRIS